MKSHYPGCMSDEECKCQDHDNDIEDEMEYCDDCGELLHACYCDEQPATK